MSRHNPKQPETFKVIHSEDDRQQIVTFIEENASLLSRLHDALTTAPGTLEGDSFVFAEPIRMTVNAVRVVLSLKKPKRETRSRGSYRITFVIRSRDASDLAPTEMLVPAAICCMRIQDAIHACNLIQRSGLDASSMLTQMVEVFLHQFVSLTHLISTEMSLH